MGRAATQRAGQSLSGLSEFEAMGDGWLDAIAPEDRERVEGRWREFR